MRQRKKLFKMKPDLSQQNSPQLHQVESNLDPTEEFVLDPGATSERDNELKDLYVPDADFDELSKFDLYKAATSVLECKVRDLADILRGVKRLEHLTRYMLHLKHVESGSKKSEKRRIRDEEGNLIYPKKSMFVLRYLGFKKKEKIIQANHLDIIKVYKSFEQLILSNKPLLKGEDLTLGSYFPLCLELTDSLTKLLLSVRSLDPEKRKGALTYLFSSVVIYRQFKVSTKPNIDSLLAPYSGKPLNELEPLFNVERMSEGVAKTWQKEVLTKKLELKFYAGNASSPNSGHSAKNLGKDLYALRGEVKLTDAIIELSKHFENFSDFHGFRGVFTAKIRAIDRDSCKRVAHSRLFHFTAPGGKSRIIANVDGVTQTALSGLHFGFYDLLSKLPQDHTFDHKKGLDHIYKGPANYYSVDLTAATDRMPRKIQQMLIEAFFVSREKAGIKGINYDHAMSIHDGDAAMVIPKSSKDLAQRWEELVDRLYDTHNSTINGGKPVRYAVGQGMGLFTSWSIMSLVHHYIVSELCGIAPENYSLVGDDLVIRGERKDFDKYLEMMTNIGVSVNLSKTVVSETDQPTVEFARNYIIMGCRIVPLQYGALLAGKDEKTSIETFVFQSAGGADTQLVGRFLQAFKRQMTYKKIACMLYYYGKNNLQDQLDLEGIGKIFPLPNGIREISFERIREITTPTSLLPEELPVYHEAFRKMPNSFRLVENLTSQVVVRDGDEILELDEIAARLLRLVKEPSIIGKYSLILFERLQAAEIIQYDCDYLGNPLITRAERRLINELMDELFPFTPVPKKNRRRYNSS